MNSFDWSIVYTPAFRRQLLHITNVTDREDAIQDAIVKLHARPVVLTRQLLHKTILNCYKDRVKAESRRKAHEQFGINLKVYEDQGWVNKENNRFEVPIPLVSNLDTADYDPSTKLEHHEKRCEMRARIKRAVRAARLSRNHLCALWVWLRGRVPEFAKRHGIPEATVRVRAKRARDALRPHLEREGFG